MPSVMNTGVSKAHLKSDVFRNYRLRRFIPLFGIIMDKIDDIFNPLSRWDRVRGFKRGHFPNGCSGKQLIHFGQVIAKGKFIEFDYGRWRNLKVYG